MCVCLSLFANPFKSFATFQVKTRLSSSAKVSYFPPHAALTFESFSENFKERMELFLGQRKQKKFRWGFSEASTEIQTNNLWIRKRAEWIFWGGREEKVCTCKRPQVLTRPDSMQNMSCLQKELKVYNPWKLANPLIRAGITELGSQNTSRALFLLISNVFGCIWACDFKLWLTGARMSTGLSKSLAKCFGTLLCLVGYALFTVRKEITIALPKKANSRGRNNQSRTGYASGCFWACKSFVCALLLLFSFCEDSCKSFSFSWRVKTCCCFFSSSPRGSSERNNNKGHLGLGKRRGKYYFRRTERKYCSALVTF